jgi:hypothetical protein
VLLQLLATWLLKQRADILFVLLHMFLIYFSLLSVSLRCAAAVTGYLVVEAAC